MPQKYTARKFGVQRMKIIPTTDDFDYTLENLSQSSQALTNQSLTITFTIKIGSDM